MSLVEVSKYLGRSSSMSTLKAYGKLVTKDISWVSDITFSPDGKFLAVSNGVDVILQDSETFQPIGEPLYGNGAVTLTGLAFSPDGKTRAVASQASYIILWDVSSQ